MNMRGILFVLLLGGPEQNVQQLDSRAELTPEMRSVQFRNWPRTVLGPTFDEMNKDIQKEPNW
jgi:hypothetical protein